MYTPGLESWAAQHSSKKVFTVIQRRHNTFSLQLVPPSSFIRLSHVSLNQDGSLTDTHIRHVTPYTKPAWLYISFLLTTTWRLTNIDWTFILTVNDDQLSYLTLLTCLMRTYVCAGIRLLHHLPYQLSYEQSTFNHKHVQRLTTTHTGNDVNTNTHTHILLSTCAMATPLVSSCLLVHDGIWNVCSYGERKNDIWFSITEHKTPL